MIGCQLLAAIYPTYTQPLFSSDYAARRRYGLESDFGVGQCFFLKRLPMPKVERA